MLRDIPKPPWLCPSVRSKAGPVHRRSKKENIMSNATNLPGVLGAYAAAYKASDLQRMRQIVLEVISADEIVLPHPENGILCYCRSSTRQALSNLLFFSDESGENSWCLVQL